MAVAAGIGIYVFCGVVARAACLDDALLIQCSEKSGTKRVIRILKEIDSVRVSNTFKFQINVKRFDKRYSCEIHVDSKNSQSKHIETCKKLPLSASKIKVPKSICYHLPICCIVI